MNQREENIFHTFKLVLTATGSHETLTKIKGLDFLFRGLSRTARALLKSVLLKVLKHSGSRFKLRSTIGNGSRANLVEGIIPCLTPKSLFFLNHLIPAVLRKRTRDQRSLRPVPMAVTGRGQSHHS